MVVVQLPCSAASHHESNCRRNNKQKLNLIAGFVALIFCVSSTLNMLFWSLRSTSQTALALSRQQLKSISLRQRHSVIPVKRTGPPYNWTIDILSIGSDTQPQHQQAQRETFGSHAAVRHFVTVTEANDYETHCSTAMPLEHVLAIQKFCTKRRHPYPILQNLTKLFAPAGYLEQKVNPAGWLCAQKRPIDGLELMFRQYYDKETLPDYLFVVDDDTYVNMPAVLDYMDSSDYINQARIVAGCLSRVKYMNFSFAYGGWGTFFSRQSLERFRQPIYCENLAGDATTKTTTTLDAENDDFVRHACRQLALNGIGELGYFKSGMSLFSVLVQYSRMKPYLKFTEKNKAAFCLHSDTALAYFGNFYRLADHASTIPGMGYPSLSEEDDEGEYWYDQDRLIGYQGSLLFADKHIPGTLKLRRQCQHRDDSLCANTAHICHYVTPQHMRDLYAARMADAVTASD